MKTKKTIYATVASFLIVILCFTTSNINAQTKIDSTMMKDCCMMKNGKMMYMKDGKTMPMEHDMTMKNGTKCMTTGDCIIKDGKKIKMQEGECMDMNGKMDKCAMMNKEKKANKKATTMTYTCPIHPEGTSEKAGKCGKCGMDLIEKK